MDAFGPSDSTTEPSTKAVDAATAVGQIAFKAFDSAGAEIYSANQNSGDTGFGALEFQLAPAPSSTPAAQRSSQLKTLG